MMICICIDLSRVNLRDSLREKRASNAFLFLFLFALSLFRFFLFSFHLPLAMPARKGLLPAGPASPPPLLPSCEKSRIPPAETRKKSNKERFVRRRAFVISALL